MNETLLAVVVASIGSSGLMSLIQFLISRNDKKAKQLNSIVEEQKDVKLELTRTQLLLLISDYPNREDEILKIAQKYFVDLNGNWFAGTIFANWCKEHNIDIPSWVK